MQATVLRVPIGPSQQLGPYTAPALENGWWLTVAAQVRLKPKHSLELKALHTVPFAQTAEAHLQPQAPEHKLALCILNIIMLWLEGLANLQDAVQNPDPEG